jgi:release factor glutamine methyltransferase
MAPGDHGQAGRRGALPAGACTVGLALNRLAAILATGRDPLARAEARQEARDIVAALLDVPRFWPSVNRDVELDGELWERARRAAARRARGAPFAYAVGRASFRHLTLEVDERVLIPRQETELLVEHTLAAGGSGGLAVDVGTGSGAIALALASEGQFERVIGTDVSLDALVVARRNAARVAPALVAPVELRHGSLLAPVRGERARLVVSNPPYITHAEAAHLPPGVRDWEPPLALFSAREGMALTAAIVRDAAEVLVPGGLLALEVDCRRAVLVAELAMTDGRYRDVSVRLDLTGRERIVLATRR